MVSGTEGGWDPRCAGRESLSGTCVWSAGNSVGEIDTTVGWEPKLRASVDVGDVTLGVVGSDGFIESNKVRVVVLFTSKYRPRALKIGVAESLLFLA